MKEEKFPHTRNPFTGRDGGWPGGSFGATEESAATGVQGQRGETPTKRIGADQHSPAREAYLLTHRDAWGLGAEARASEVRPQGEDWGWLREHRLKGLVRHSQPGGSLGKGLELPKRQETTVSGCARRGDSEHHLNELQRRARAAAISADTRDKHETLKAAAATTKKPVCKHRSLSTPPLLGACAACHCQGPVIQGQLPGENTRHASGCCNVMVASAATGSPRIPYPFLPWPE